MKNWADNITQEIYNVWKSKYSDWRPGVKVFYSPVIKNPELMIISYQPGGNEVNFENEDKSRFEKGDFSVRKNEFLVADYLMARKIRHFFGDRKEILEKSVIFPMIFFRASTARMWRGIRPIAKRVEMEEFCLSKVKEIIEKVAPVRLLVIGMETLNALKKILDIKDEKILYRRKGQSKGERMVISAIWGNRRIFVTAHLSGVRMSKSDRAELSRLFFLWF